jgi:hypothetical protein
MPWFKRDSDLFLYLDALTLYRGKITVFSHSTRGTGTKSMGVGLEIHKQSIADIFAPRCPRWLERQKRTYLLRLDPWTPLLASSTQTLLSLLQLHDISGRSLLRLPLSLLPHSSKRLSSCSICSTLQDASVERAWLRASAPPLSIGPAPYTTPSPQELLRKWNRGHQSN